ncbi:hypothetical protein Hanom_Chr11g01012631 [Helianthus anomalus]
MGFFFMFYRPSINNRPDPYVTTRRPDRPAPGPTSGSMLKRVKGLNRPGGVSGSRPDRSDRPARSGFKKVAENTCRNERHTEKVPLEALALRPSSGTFSIYRTKYIGF